jgi:hypothetical protein
MPQDKNKGLQSLLGRNWAMPTVYKAYWAAIGLCRTNIRKRPVTVSVN